MAGILRIDDWHDRNYASNGVSRLQAYMRQHADRIRAAAADDDEWDNGSNRGWLACMLEVATGPIMRPGYIKVTDARFYPPRLTRCQDTGTDFVQLRLELRSGDFGLRLPGVDWREPGDTIREPRPVMATTATLSIPVDLGGLWRPAEGELISDIENVKATLSALVDRINSAATQAGINGGDE